MSVGPVYQSVRAERVTTLSPCRADTGTLTASERPSSRATRRTSSAIAVKTSSA